MHFINGMTNIHDARVTRHAFISDLDTAWRFKRAVDSTGATAEVPVRANPDAPWRVTYHATDAERDVVGLVRQRLGVR